MRYIELSCNRQYVEFIETDRAVDICSLRFECVKLVVIGDLEDVPKEVNLWMRLRVRTLGL